MNKDLEKALEVLEKEDYTCVLCRNDKFLSSRRRGVAPLLELLDSGEELSGFSAADRVVGKAAAMLYVLMGVSCVHARVMSEGARQVLLKAGIGCLYGELVPAIFNRTNTGFCPMETAVRDIDDPMLAPELIKEKLRQLNSGN